MNPGVPMKSSVAEFAMLLVKSWDDYSILTNIQTQEVAYGDLYFKVACKKEGITALQMDNKIEGLSTYILEEALQQAKQGRLEILTSMLETIDQPLEGLSDYAPKILTMQIKPEKIRDVIGPSGKQI